MSSQETLITTHSVETPSGRISYASAGSGPAALFEGIATLNSASSLFTGRVDGTIEFDAREGQAGRTGVAERPVLPLKPGNAGGGKGPQFKTDARRGEGPGDWAT